MSALTMAYEQDIEKLKAQVAALEARLAELEPLAARELTRTSTEYAGLEAYAFRCAQDHPAHMARIAALEAALLDADTLHLADEQTIRNVEARFARVLAPATVCLVMDSQASPDSRWARACAVDACSAIAAALAADARPAVMAPTLPSSPWRGPILCDECGGTEHEPRGLCGGSLHPKGSDAGSASNADQRTSLAAEIRADVRAEKEPR